MLWRQKHLKKETEENEEMEERLDKAIPNTPPPHYVLHPVLAEKTKNAIEWQLPWGTDVKVKFSDVWKKRGGRRRRRGRGRGERLMIEFICIK